MHDDEARATLGRCRTLLGLLRSPTMRQALGEQLRLSDSDLPSTRLPPGMTWLGPGEVERTELGRDIAALQELMSPLGLLSYGPISTWPSAEAEKSRFVAAVIARVFASTRSERMAEPELNARISMLATDVSGVRRYAVDTGLMEREIDGSAYWLPGG